VRFAVDFWKDACDEGGLAWDDSNNNRAFLSGTICATLNGATIYIEALRNPNKYTTHTGARMHTDILHAPLPAGPGGAYGYHVPAVRPCRSPLGEGHRGVLQVHHHRHVRQGGPRDGARERRQVGRSRTEADLRLSRRSPTVTRAEPVSPQ